MSLGTLYVVATPLGNLKDISERAREVLAGVDAVAAEDTRRSRKLLAHLGASRRVLSFHAHSSEQRLRQILNLLLAGKSVALISDAGTPVVSDPGAGLVSRARELGVPIVAVPGPSAVTAALSVSGFPADRYTFLGFLPRSGKGREELLEQIVASPWTVVVFEAANRLVPLLEELANLAEKDRRAAVARELTKIHEECRVGTLRELAGYYRESPPRGEVTLVVEGRPRQRKEDDLGEAGSRARELLEQGLSRRDAAARLVEELGLTRNQAYRLMTKL